MDRIKLKNIPEKPGSYQYLDKDRNIIYVGKAKNLKKRVNSYFNKEQEGKTKLLVDDIDDLTYIVTSTEVEALILEINLIKKFNPKYNIMLKDDKSYPYIALSKGEAPLLTLVRKSKKNQYKDMYLFGPYPNVGAARYIVRALNRIYPLRKCNPLKKDYCLYYHMEQCLGYCKNKISVSETKEYVNEIKAFLNGDTKLIETKLRKQMKESSLSYNYEKALDVKKTLDFIDEVIMRQKIDLNSDINYDFFNYYVLNGKISITSFFVRGGVLIGSFNDILDYEEGVFTDYIINFYEHNKIVASGVLVPENEDIDLLNEYIGPYFKVPQKGKLKKLLNLVYDNSKTYLEEHINTVLIKDDKRKKAISELNKVAGKNVTRIFSFDNSHLFGEYYVSSLVAFDNFKKNKNLYRKFKIKGDSKDDLSALKEVIYRYFFKVLTENAAMPDMLLIDGGELQVKAVLDTLKELNIDLLVWGLKKDDRHKGRVVVNQNLEEINLGETLFLYLSKIDEEAHRFAITYHRDLKKKGVYSSLIDDVKGLGPKRKKALLKRFKTIEGLSGASLDELRKIVPEEVALELLSLLKDYKKDVI